MINLAKEWLNKQGINVESDEQIAENIPESVNAELWDKAVSIFLEKEELNVHFSDSLSMWDKIKT